MYIYIYIYRERERERDREPSSTSFFLRGSLFQNPSPIVNSKKLEGRIEDNWCRDSVLQYFCKDGGYWVSNFGESRDFGV